MHSHNYLSHMPVDPQLPRLHSPHNTRLHMSCCAVGTQSLYPVNKPASHSHRLQSSLNKPHVILHALHVVQCVHLFSAPAQHTITITYSTDTLADSPIEQLPVSTAPTPPTTAQVPHVPLPHVRVRVCTPTPQLSEQLPHPPLHQQHQSQHRSTQCFSYHVLHDTGVPTQTQQVKNNMTVHSRVSNIPTVHVLSSDVSPAHADPFVTSHVP